MALSALIRKASPSASLFVIGSSLTTLNRSISVPGQRDGLVKKSLRSFSSVENARDLADENLYEIVKRRIKFTKSKLENLQVNMPPDSFPFKVEDKKHPDRIEVSSKFHDEDVVIRIKWSDVNNKELETSKTPFIPMGVIVGRDQALCFQIIASVEDIIIQSIHRRNECGYRSQKYLEFKDLSFELQLSLYKYLEVRGIKSDYISFVIKTLIMKKKENDLMALKYLKGVIY